MRKNKLTWFMAVVVVLACGAHTSQASGNPFMNERNPETSRQGSNLPPVPSPIRNVTVNTMPGLPMPGIPSSLPPPGFAGQYPPGLGGQKEQAPAVPPLPWRIIGKMGGDQIAIQSTVSDSGITIVRDGSMVGDCYVLFPDIACEKPAIESMKKRNNLTIDATRMKTEIEIERINARNSEKKQQQALAEATRLQAQNNHLSSQIESLKKSAEYPSADVESLRATIKARDAVIAGHQQTIGQQSAQIATLNATIKECDASAAGNQKTIEQLAAQVTVLKTIIKDRDATIAASKQKTTENLPGQIEALKITLSECNATIASSQKTIGILKAGVADSDRKGAAAAKELEATRKQPPKVVEKMVEKVVAPKIPDWLTGDYADAAISGITVGYRRSSPTKVIIRLPLKDWPAVSPTISKHLSDTWEDSRYKYTLLQQGAFSLSLPAAKGGIN